ncbi:MAG: hypothetical protein WC233_03990 [Sphaerochaeta sp.]
MIVFVLFISFFVHTCSLEQVEVIAEEPEIIQVVPQAEEPPKTIDIPQPTVEIPPIISEDEEPVEIVDEEPLIEEIFEEPAVEELLGLEPEEEGPIRVPLPPFMFEPYIYSEDEFDPFWDDPFFDQITDEDFWADFFVVGEDATIAFDDGFYFLNLFINDELVGDIEVEFDGETRRINGEELSFYVVPHLTGDAYQRIFTSLPPFVSLEELETMGVTSRYNADAFAVYLTFNLQDMPERMISITSASINRRQQYGMSGAIELKPVKFALASTLSLYAMADYTADPFELNNRLLSLSVSNRASIFGVGVNFYFSITPRLNTTSSQKVFNFGSWNGFYDFVESSHRLSFGNIGTSLASVPGATSIGLLFEKNYAYGTQSAKGSQFEHRVTLYEPSTVQIEINGEKVFERRFQPGTYRLRDFVFTQGANQILIRTITDSGETHSEYVDMGYDYRLLGKGDSLYGVGISMPREKSATKNGTFSIPWLGEQYLSYHPAKFTATWYQQIGLTDTFTFSSDLAYSPGLFSGTFSGVLATMFGTSQLQVTIGLDETKANPSLMTSYGHRFSGRYIPQLAALSMNLSVSIPAFKADESFYANSSLSLSYSGNITEKIRYTLSSNLSWKSDDNLPAWSASFATGFSPFRGFSISGSVTASGAADAPTKPAISAQISGSYSFSSKLSANTSTSLRFADETTAVTSAGVSWRPSSNDSVSFSLNGLRYDDPKNHTLTGYWNHNGSLSSFSVRQQVTSATGRMATTFTASTSFAYAGGAFGIGRSVNDSFLLVKPKGELRKSQISVARSLDSAPSYLSRPLGSALYNSISPNVKNSIVVFATGATDYSTGHSFVFEAQPRSRQSFVAQLDVEPSFTISGLLYEESGEPYIQYSSPVYRVIEGEEGERELVRDDSLYLFTDQDGRFILSEVKGGTYLFDLRVDDEWWGVEFTVPLTEGEKVGLDRVLLLEEFWVSDPTMSERIIRHDLSPLLFEYDELEEVDIFGTEIAEGYDAEIVLEVVDRIDEESFWSIIFPPFDEDAFGFEFFDDEFVTHDDFYFDEALFDTLTEGWEGEQSTQVITAAP